MKTDGAMRRATSTVLLFDILLLVSRRHDPDAARGPSPGVSMLTRSRASAAHEHRLWGVYAFGGGGSGLVICDRGASPSDPGIPDPRSSREAPVAGESRPGDAQDMPEQQPDDIVASQPGT